MTTTIPDEDSLKAALYGTAHMEIVQAFKDIDRMIKDYEEHIFAVCAEIIPEISYWILYKHPETIYMKDVELKSLKVTQNIYIRTIELLQDIEKTSLAIDMVKDWRNSIDRRGRNIGNAERSVRANLSGIIDVDYKTAVNRFREGGTA